jgi:hypothetical protein
MKENSLLSPHQSPKVLENEKGSLATGNNNNNSRRSKRRGFYFDWL